MTALQICLVAGAPSGQYLAIVVSICVAHASTPPDMLYTSPNAFRDRKIAPASNVRRDGE